MLSLVFAAQDGQPFPYSRPDHERVRRTEPHLVRFRQEELLHVQPQLAHVVWFLDGHLARVSAVLLVGIVAVHEHRVVLAGDITASEFGCKISCS